ncbi:ATP phosphoribosyltransferase (ATP-PRTase) (ATP-PRT) [Desmophyllum pertusum]|uniref:ATP phosphoribosyltransferase n=1 Tax=Desmophyllum pertusum TaxID=174260 RepID=A0A9W9ZVZ6_9CNID|nr:ATP phosphoribosyltransferase (ATP-PRTase) (ATP-PRT) [Desmophyllum pertusum]
MASIQEDSSTEGRCNRLHISDEQLKRRMLMAVPKKGRLYDQCIGLLERAGIKYRKKVRLDLALCTSLNMALVFLPASDIALYVSQGRIDMGITGKDVVAESGGEVHEILKLGFGKCKLAVQAAVTSNISSTKELVGKRIVTSFPNVARKYFAQFDPENTTKINYVSGSVEVACSLGVADGIVDLVETGDTMRAAGLEVVSEILETEAVLIANPNTHFQDVIKTVKSRLEGIINANKYVMVEYNVERTNLAKGLKITPGKSSATLSPLDNDDWVAVQSLILQHEENHILDKLEEIGAHDIVTFNVQNCRV